jgi:hypothetical protein
MEPPPDPELRSPEAVREQPGTDQAQPALEAGPASRVVGQPVEPGNDPARRAAARARAVRALRLREAGRARSRAPVVPGLGPVGALPPQEVALVPPVGLHQALGKAAADPASMPAAAPASWAARVGPAGQGAEPVSPEGLAERVVRAAWPALPAAVPPVASPVSSSAARGARAVAQAAGPERGPSATRAAVAQWAAELRASSAAPAHSSVAADLSDRAPPRGGADDPSDPRSLAVVPARSFRRRSPARPPALPSA